MDPTLITEVTNQLGLTPEQTGALITLAALGGTLAIIWRLILTPFETLKRWIKSYFVRTIQLHISDPGYEKFNLWLEQHKQYIYLQRSYKIVNAAGGTPGRYCDDEEYNDSSNGKYSLVPGFGTVWVKAPNHPLMSINRQIEEGKQIYEQTENLRISFITLNPERILKFCHEALSSTQKRCAEVFEIDYGSWISRGTPRDVFEPLGKGAADFMDSIESFLGMEQEYTNRNLPYKRGFLLHGQPGTGKTSIISHVAKKHDLNLYILDSKSIKNISSLAYRMRPNSILVIEDIDFTVVGEKREKSSSRVKGDNLSEDEVEVIEEKNKMADSNREALHKFLNVLDGIVSFDVNLVIATTNRPENLDPALIRPGRLDESIEIGALTQEDQIIHVNRFYNKKLTMQDVNFPERTFAELQFLCTKNMMDFDRFLEEANV